MQLCIFVRPNLSVENLKKPKYIGDTMDILNLKSIDDALGIHVEKRGVLISFCGQGKKFEGKKEGTRFPVLL